jgi:glutathione S-transferase
LWPKDALAEAKALSLIGYFASSVHPAHAHISRPERYATDTAMFPNIQEQGRKTFHGYLKQIDGMLAGRQWLSDQYSVLDPYGLLFYAWGLRRELPVAELKNYSAFKAACCSAPPCAASSRRRRSRFDALHAARIAGIKSRPLYAARFHFFAAAAMRDHSSICTRATTL